jgi:hypothetical protein
VIAMHDNETERESQRAKCPREAHDNVPQPHHSTDHRRLFIVCNRYKMKSKSATRCPVFLLAACSFMSVPTVNASWHNSRQKRLVPCHPKTNTYDSSNIDRRMPIMSIRGGSESASAWSAGSRYDYRSPKTSSSFSSRDRSSVRQKPFTVDVENDSKEQTKEAIATAFLNREDRNRFIGKLVALWSIIYYFTFIYSM